MSHTALRYKQVAKLWVDLMVDQAVFCDYVFVAYAFHEGISERSSEAEVLELTEAGESFSVQSPYW